MRLQLSKIVGIGKSTEEQDSINDAIKDVEVKLKLMNKSQETLKRLNQTAYKTPNTFSNENIYKDNLQLSQQSESRNYL